MRVALITKTKTQNQGNQALSIAWRDYLAERYPSATLGLVERGPRYLKRYTLSSLTRACDSISAFDLIAGEVLQATAGASGSDPSVWDVEHDPAQSQVIRYRKLRQALRLRSRLGGLRIGSEAYRSRLAWLTGADLVVVNPAGEFFPDANDTALHYLLETRCAQLAGCRTAFVNLSFEVTNPTLIRISDHVFEHCDLVSFRDRESAEYFVKKNCNGRPIVLPDAALLTALPASPLKRPAGTRGIALAINALQAHSHNLERAWKEIFAKLCKRGPVTLTSNEWTTDEPFWNDYLSLGGVQADGHSLGCHDYARFLAGFDIVVSSRMHTCILGLVAGAAVVPVETGTFKLTGFFNQIGMMDEPIQTSGADWQERLFDRIDAVAADRDSCIAKQHACIGAARQRLRAGLNRAFVESFAHAQPANSHAGPNTLTGQRVYL